MEKEPFVRFLFCYEEFSERRIPDAFLSGIEDGTILRSSSFVVNVFQIRALLEAIPIAQVTFLNQCFLLENVGSTKYDRCH